MSNISFHFISFEVGHPVLHLISTHELFWWSECPGLVSSIWQNCRDKKNLDFLFCFLILSGKLGKQSLRFHTSITFFFGITVFLYLNENPVHHIIHWRQFCTSLTSIPRKHCIFADTLDTCIGRTHEAWEETEDECVSIHSERLCYADWDTYK